MNASFSLKSWMTAGAAALALVAAMQAHASIVIAGTRVIYNEKEPEVTLKLSNVGNTPTLVQAWVDNGDPRISPTSVDVPFIVTPPASRIEPGKAQTLRIIHSAGTQAQAQDHESVYWLDVLEIPPKATGSEADGNQLQLAFRTRIKLFYRPDGLKGHPEDAPAQLAWRLVTQNGHPALEVHNPGEYHVSLTDAGVFDGNGKAVFEEGEMVGPGETRILPLKGSPSVAHSAVVRYHAVNDYGGTVEGTAQLR